MRQTQAIPQKRISLYYKFAKYLLTPKVTQHFKVNVEESQILDLAEDLLAHCQPMIRFYIRFVLFLFEWEAIFYFGKPFTQLDEPKSNLYFKIWAESHSFIRYVLLRPLLVFVFAGYYATPQVAKKLGFEEKINTSIKPKELSGILQKPSRDSEIEVEVCVIGSGAGGAVVAKKMAEYGHEVLIVEEGGFFSTEHFQSLPTYKRNGLMYRDGGFVATVGVPTILLPTGKTLGGTTTINAGTCYRTPERVINKWRDEYGLSDLSLQELNPHFEAIESFLNISPVPWERAGGNNFIIEEGVRKIDEQIKNGPCYFGPLIPHNHNRNSPSCQANGLCIYGCPSGAKMSMEKSFIPEAVKLGAKIHTQLKVSRFVKNGSKVEYAIAQFEDPLTGVKGPKLKIRAKKFILSGGTLNSPRLISRSGIGLESGQLGKNLTIHPTAKIVALFDREINAVNSVFQGFGFEDSMDHRIRYESVFFPPWMLATSIFQCQEKHFEIMKAFNNIAIHGFLVHDEGRGRVFDGLDGRAVVLYNLGKAEMELFVKGLKILGEVFFAAGAKKLWPTIRTFHEIHTLEELRRIHVQDVNRRDLESAAFHPLGTCRMGADPKKSVVDPNLRVHEMQNLWIVDGSVFPTSLGVNPQVTIMSFAHRAAWHIHKA